jgi:hypothetical protein
VLVPVLPPTLAPAADVVAAPALPAVEAGFVFDGEPVLPPPPHAATTPPTDKIQQHACLAVRTTNDLRVKRER